jgi:hypothetical protein
MKRVQKWSLGLVAIIAMLLGLSAALAPRKPLDDQHTVASIGSTSTSTAVQQRIVLEANLEVRSWIALGASLTDQDGHVVRPAAFSCSFLYRHVHLGEAHWLRVLNAGGHESIHLELSGLDLGLGDPTLSVEASARSYQIDVSPKTGLSWEAVADPRQDTVIAVTPLH